MASTTPAWSGSSIESPMAMESSTTMNSPVIRSCTRLCAPKPMARPTTPAPASSGVTLTPRLASTAITVITSRPMSEALRTSGRMVLTRRLGCAPRPCAGDSDCMMAVSISSQTSQASSTVLVTLKTVSVRCRPAADDSARRTSDVPQTRITISMKTAQISTRTSASAKRPKRCR
ncbi:hypothetical protein D9M72_222640 [compost metagenome]